MPVKQITREERFGLLHPAHDVHTLGLTTVAQLLESCGIRAVLGQGAIAEAAGNPAHPLFKERLAAWIRDQRLTRLGFSYRLDPDDGARLMGLVAQLLKDRRLVAEEGGPIRAVYFAGLPSACEKVRRQIPLVAAVFRGDETQEETLRLLGVEMGAVPSDVKAGLAYDEQRLAFGRDLIRKGEYLAVKPVDRTGYTEFGTSQDTVIARLQHGRRFHLPPLVRAHVGPYHPDRYEAVRLFLRWTRELAEGGLLDVLSIGASQLTQSHFGLDWTGLPNGGGVPIQTPEEYEEVWKAARPMLVRTYAGTRGLRALAAMYEERIHIAWHALSFWWFCRLDGRGPNTVRENLDEHLATIRDIAARGKPLEANVAHHFAFRGSDDVSALAAVVLAARTAKRLGIRHFILQIMLNTPKATWGLHDLAKARALLRLVRELEDERFTVILQPRGGLDYFSPDLEKAKAQLAAVTALMDDIEPRDPNSPPILHVVSYSEASDLADPAIINESIRITRNALEEYRRLRQQGSVDDLTDHPEIRAREEELLRDLRLLIQLMEHDIPSLYSAMGLYRALAGGYLLVPWLTECRDEFSLATRWTTRIMQGAVRAVDSEGRPLSVSQRLHSSLLTPSRTTIGTE